MVNMTTKSKINYFEEGLKEIRQFKKEDKKTKKDEKKKNGK